MDHTYIVLWCELDQNTNTGYYAYLTTSSRQAQKRWVPTMVLMAVFSSNFMAALLVQLLVFSVLLCFLPKQLSQGTSGSSY